MKNNKNANVNKDMIYGKNTVLEIINTNQGGLKIYVAKKTLEKNDILLKFQKQNPNQIKICSMQELDQMTNYKNHQGIAAIMPPFKYKTLEECITKKGENEQPVFLVLDQLQDPHNFGAIIRTAVACGVDSIIIAKNRSVGVTPAVMKVAVGMIEYINIIQVTNINMTLKKLKETGFWIIGSALNKKSIDYRRVDVDMPLAVVVGNEGKGISRIVLDECDYLVHIPMKEKANSLNASVATAVLLYEIYNKKNPIN